MKKQKSYWKTIGHVAVDSGTLMITDPSYAVDFDGKDYEKFVIDKAYDKSVQVPFDLGHLGRAIIFASGCGDGYYEVKAKFSNLKDWGERITEVRIIMK